MPARADNTNKPTPTAGRSLATIWIASAAVLGFLVGFLIQVPRLNRANGDLERTTRSLHAARSEVALSAAVIEAQSGRYEAARQRTSDFYTGLQRQLLPALASDQQAEVRAMLTERDSIITSLARNDPTSPGVLAAVLVRLRETLRLAAVDSSLISNDSTR